MRNVSDKICRENHNAHFTFGNFIFENRAVYKIKWKIIVGRGKPQMTVWNMRIARWIPKATNTHSDYVIFTAFKQQQWLYERASIIP
jgi:hypothetical protein